MDPKGKVALITGGGSGIGRATALALANAGASIVIADINDDGGRETVRLIEEAGGTAAFVHVDVTKRDDLERMVAFAEETFGGLDIFHNNAGIGTPQPRFPAAPPDLWERTITVDLWAVIAGVQAVEPAMRRRGGGVIVNTASIAGLIAHLPDPIYAAAKHGVVGLSRSLAFLKDEANIRVNCVCPGVVDTPMVRGRPGELTEAELKAREAFVASMPLIRPEEIAEAVLEFVLDDSLAGQAMAITHGPRRRLIDPPLRFREDPSQRP
ncbi:MAG TPA: SDR family NAD(P)-dependent oxidoreductase [Dehalococcoidia bacterium]|jgi:NAD(P)-dependent dehydrogenase (short-subunit alcohol dehydrogenase family)|nr:SDR family NAD(P)-dependent oxidoreductase [Dehalococcoidia bacterium]